LGRANVWGIAVHEEDVGIGRAKNKEQARVRSHVNDACDRAKPAGGMRQGALLRTDGSLLVSTKSHRVDH